MRNASHLSTLYGMNGRWNSTALSLRVAVVSGSAVSIGGCRYQSDMAQTSQGMNQQGTIPKDMLIQVSVLSHGGPMARYASLVQQGRLREDSHQKGTFLSLYNPVSRVRVY